MEENTAVSSSPSKHGIRLTDCICPICMSILFEPVTMPCAHELCRPCFRDTVEQVNFTCPLCRLRISNWARKQARVNKLINWARWKEIQTAFPELCRKRLEGEDIDVLQPLNPVRVCKPGEVRQEYEQQMRELQKQREEEEKVEKDKSQRAIQEIQEEELRQYEERRREEERLAVLDEQLARKLADSEEPEIHVVGNLADEQARLDEQLARVLQEEQDPQGISEQTQKDEEFARKLQDEFEKTSITSQTSSKRLTPRSKKNTKIPATNIERFFQKTQPEESSQSLACNTSGNSSKDDVLPSFPTFDEEPSVVSMDSYSISPMFLGPSTSKVIRQADVSLICVEDYNNVLDIECNENSNTQKNFKHEPSEEMESDVGEQNDGLCLSQPCFSATNFDECSLLETKDLTPSPIAVVHLSPPTDVDDDEETRSTKEEVMLKTGGAFSPISKTPPTGVARKNTFRSDSVGSTDSISHELSHFRPIVISPRTAARKLADGKPVSPALIHSTPKNLRKALETGESGILQKSPLLMAKWLSLAQERETKVLVGSKSVMAGRSVIQEQNGKKSFTMKPLHLNSSKFSLDSKNDPGNSTVSTDDNSTSLCQSSVNVNLCQSSVNVNPTDEVKRIDAHTLKKQSLDCLSSESRVATTTENKVETYDDQTTEGSSIQTSCTLKRSPGKVYHMKGRTPSHSRRKDLTKLLTSSCENACVSTTRCTAKEARIDKIILNKIVRQKDDMSRKMEEVKTDDTDYDEEIHESVEYNPDEGCTDLKQEHDTEIKCKDSIKGQYGCSRYHLSEEEKIEENRTKDQPSGMHSEEKNIKKKNPTEEKGRRKQHSGKECRTIEDMFAKFQKKLGNDDFKSDENNVCEIKASSITKLREKKIDEDLNDNDGLPTFTRSQKSPPVQDHQVLILNQTLSFKQKGDSGKPSIHQTVESGNKRKCDETPDGKCNLKFKQVSSYSSPKKTQLLGLSPSPKKAKLNCSKRKTLTGTRNDNEPMSPGTWKHNRFLKLQTKEERRLQQEELDRQVALKLQREINREMKAELNNVNRSRGSESEYQLRSRKPIYKTVLSNLP